MGIVMVKIFNNCISGCLNNNYFHLNESSASTNNVLFIQNCLEKYLSKKSKTFNALTLIPYSYPRQRNHWT